MRKFFAFIILLCSFIHVLSQETAYSQNPKTLKILDSTVGSSQFYVKSHQQLLEKAGISLNPNSKGTPIEIKISKAFKNPEGFKLFITNKSVLIESGTEKGAYYGLLRLKEWINSPNKNNVEITDYPDVKFRGVVEGFYGTPWKYHDRLRMLEFLGANKMNTYIYGPKDDPYHSSPHWRKDYPQEQANQIKDYVLTANENFVDFYWAIHPGKDIKWNNDDRQNLLHKFHKMYDLGVRGFSVFFDDITGEGTNAKKQAELLNFLQKEFVDKKHDVLPLIMCPTEYNRSWSNLEGGYLTTLGKELDPRIHIMWTGDGVIGDVTTETLTWINDKIKRKAFFWWNFPVTDYVRDHLMLGPAYTLDNKALDLLSGIVSNPMEHAEASRIAIASVGDYAWDIANYDSIQSWKNNIKKEFPLCYKSYEIFASNHADPGTNGHKYRKLESWDFIPLSDKFLKALKNNTLSDEVKTEVKTYYSELYNAAVNLQQCKDNPALILEIYPWILQTKNITRKGLETLNMYDALSSNDKEEFFKAYKKAEEWELRQFYLDNDENQNKYQPGIASASRIVKPFIDSTFSHLVRVFNKKENMNLDVNAYYNPHLFSSNNTQLQNLKIDLSNKVLRASPLLEVVSLKPNDFFMYEFQPEQTIKQIVFNLGDENKMFDEWGMMEVSINGTDWEPLKGFKAHSGWVSQPYKKVKFLRFKNVGKTKQEIYLKRFDVSI